MQTTIMIQPNHKQEVMLIAASILIIKTGSNNVNSGTKGNDNVKASGSNSHINTNDDKRSPK
ncbi:MAG TPA: hypothetical protein VKG26_03535 [Bacteroidia bacterium]|nr:hypothetical protein [Bacteroidia bacterium]